MKVFLSATKRFFSEIWSDAMLVALVFIPLLMGLFFRFVAPALEEYLCGRTGQAMILATYYPILDLLLSIMTPLMFTAAGAMVILDEADLGIAKAISVTPVGRGGYLASRVGVTALLATVYSGIVMNVFNLSDMSVLKSLLLVVCSGVLSVAEALMISTMAKNKVEGLAYSKLTGLFVLGLPAAMLIPAPFKYAFAFLPTFWMTEFTLGGSLWLAVPAVVISTLLSVFFARYFNKKALG